MTSRVGVSMGLLAFAITLFGGLVTDNSFAFTLSRALWAMLIFCSMGLVLGWCAGRVVREYRAKQHAQILGPAEPQQPAPVEENSPEDTSTTPTAQPINN